MLVGEAAPSGPVGGKVLASRARQFFASAEASSIAAAWALIEFEQTF